MYTSNRVFILLAVLNTLGWLCLTLRLYSQNNELGYDDMKLNLISHLFTQIIGQFRLKIENVFTSARNAPPDLHVGTSSAHFGE